MDDRERHNRRDELKRLLHRAFEQQAKDPQESLRLLQKVCESEAQQRTLSPEEYFVVLNNLGCIQVEVGGWSAGRDMLAKSLEVAKEEIGSRSREYAIGLEAMARYKLQRAVSPQIKEYLLESVKILSDADSQLWRISKAKSMLYLGITCRLLLQYAEGERWGEQAVKLFEEYANVEPEHLVVSLYSLGETYAKTGKHEQSEECYLRALSFLEKLPQLDKEHKAQILLNLAISKQRKKSLADAERYFTEAIREYEKINPEHPMLIRCLTAYADHLRRDGRSEAADKVFTRVNAMRENMRL
ncbi:MAG TPA: tetratricopeptide repeat protein [Drouetiella sp.]